MASEDTSADHSQCVEVATSDQCSYMPGAAKAGYFATLEDQDFWIPHESHDQNRSLEALRPEQKKELRNLEKRRGRQNRSEELPRQQRGEKMQSSDPQQNSAHQKSPDTRQNTFQGAVALEVPAAPTLRTDPQAPQTVAALVPARSDSAPRPQSMLHRSPQHFQSTSPSLTSSHLQPSPGHKQVPWSPTFEDLEPLDAANYL